jgi:hypothetical protein
MAREDIATAPVSLASDPVTLASASVSRASELMSLAVPGLSAAPAGRRYAADDERMRAAAMAAPKPLSMFTTVIPEAQLFSIVKRAAIPWKLAP